MTTDRFSPVLDYLRGISSEEDRCHSDVVLLRRFLDEGEESAFEVLLQRHGPLVLGACQRALHQAQDIEDAFQATFLILAQNARSIRKLTSLSSWLYGVAIRTARKAGRLSQRRKEGERQAPSPPMASTPEEEAIWAEVRQHLDEVLGQLPEKYRAPVLLCYVQGKTYQEAAHQLGWSPGTVSTRLSRAKEMLRERLARRGVVLSSATMASLISHRAGGAVPVSLASSTLQRIQQALAPAGAKALSLHLVALTQQGASMTFSKIAMTCALGFFLVTGGAGLEAEQKPQSGNNQTRKASNGTFPVRAEGKKEPKANNGSPAAVILTRRQHLLELLNERKTMEKLDDPTITLGLMLQTLSSRVFQDSAHPLSFEINRRAFEAQGEAQVEQKTILEKPLPRMVDVPFRRYLKRVLERAGATFLVRKDHIEITTEAAIKDEIWGKGHSGPFLPLVNATFDKVPLKDALKKLAEQAHQTVLIDPKVEEEAQLKITTELINIPLDTAVAFLADMARLEVVPRHNLLYITDKENAEKWHQRLQSKAKSSKPSSSEGKR